MSTPISRAAFLKLLAALGLSAAAAKFLAESKIGCEWLSLLKQSTSFSPKFPCRILGPSQKVGHLLRGKQRTGPISHSRKATVTIIGGGIAGLSAAWWLKKEGLTDFVVLDLEQDVGGNSASGKNQISAFPWGAHYVPIANSESKYVRQLFEELKIIQGYDASAEPIYDELMLCHQPQDRLFKDGAFHDGLVPKRGLQKRESDDISRFFEQMIVFRQAQGNDGQPAFAIPLDLSSQDRQFTALDKISMAQWLKENQYDTKPLLWYVDYCCRDDYGSTAEFVSAWAGIHYFAGRRGTAANSEQNAVLTWPQGNGFLVEKLKKPLSNNILVNALATQLKEEEGGKILTTYLNTQSNKFAAIESDFVVLATPRFIANRLVPEAAPIYAHSYAPIYPPIYAPWMVANISLKHLPDGQGALPAWDNVSYYSQSLGYVVANHQEITTRFKPTVITYYFPLSQQEPKLARNALYAATTEEWSKSIVQDLEKMHPGIGNEIISIDLWPWGHGMVRPSVGEIWGESRQSMKEPRGNIFFAHSDMSGISNFEEAQYHGVEAAKMILARLQDQNKSN
ncbi:MAG: FAD-dependent oxidoreductase [Candidatus Obscuribacterales bacterium]